MDRSAYKLYCRWKSAYSFDSSRSEGLVARSSSSASFTYNFTKRHIYLYKWLLLFHHLRLFFSNVDLWGATKVRSHMNSRPTIKCNGNCSETKKNEPKTMPMMTTMASKIAILNYRLHTTTQCTPTSSPSRSAQSRSKTNIAGSKSCVSKCRDAKDHAVSWRRGALREN